MTEDIQELEDRSDAIQQFLETTLKTEDGSVLVSWVVMTEWTNPNLDTHDPNAWEIRVDTPSGDPPSRAKGIVHDTMDRGLLDNYGPEEDEDDAAL